MGHVTNVRGNNMLKKLLVTIISIGLLTSCTSSTTNHQEKDSLKVITTIFPPYDFIREIAGEKVSLSMLIPLGSETHHYEPTIQDMKNIADCDIFIYTGGESDEWVSTLLKDIDTSNITIIKLMDVVDIVEEEIKEGMDVEEEDDDGNDDEEAHDYDEHVWTSLRNSMIIVQELSKQLIALDPANTTVYQENTMNYLQQLQTLDNEFSQVVENASRNTLIFGDRFPFRYFVEDYNLDYYAAFPGCSTMSDASASTITFLIDKVKQENIPVVFYIEFSTELIADVIVESTNATKLIFNSAHTISKEDFDNGVTYLSIMQQNLDNLKVALYD